MDDQLARGGETNSLFTPDADALPEVEAGAAGEKSVFAFALAVLEKVASLLERRKVDVSGCGACCCFGVVDGRSAVLAGLIFDCCEAGVLSVQFRRRHQRSPRM
jgi:hypothetical protein